MKYIILPLSFLLLWSCSSDIDQAELDTPSIPVAKTVALEKNDFKDYWYQGKAEITSYKLEQARYGELHQGTAVNIFVTERFFKI